MVDFDMETVQPDPQDVEKNKAMAILAYFGCLWFIPFFVARDSAYVRFHLNQGLLLFLAGLALWFVGMIVSFVGIGMGILSLTYVYPIVYMGVFALAIMGIISAVKGEMKPLPLIGGITIIR